MSKIKKIDQSVCGYMQSQVKINTLSDAIRELTQNGVDAGATNIKINVKVQYAERTVEIDYTDDGEGIGPESMEVLGKRFFTSKLISNSEGPDCDLSMLQRLTTFGFRGEAFNSLLNICSSVLVVSRVKHYNCGFKACFQGDERIGNIVKNNGPVPIGTSIKLIGFFDPVIVRKNILLNNIENRWTQDTFEIKRVVLDSLINKPWIKVRITRQEFKQLKWVSKVLVDKASTFTAEKVSFQSQMSLFKSIFGEKTCEDYELCKVQLKNIQLKAGIGLSSLQTKSYQFIYLNGRPFISEEMVKYVNQLFQKKYELWGHNAKNSRVKSPSKKSSSMYGRPYSVNPVFVASFSAPINISELMQDPSKACYTTKNMKILLFLFTKVIEVYFGIYKKKRKGTIEKEQAKSIVKSKRQKVQEYAVLSSDSTVSKYKESELNGRLTDTNPATIEEFPRKMHDFNKITNKLALKEHFRTMDQPGHGKREEGLVDENDIGSHCSNCYKVQKQDSLKRQSFFFNNIDKVVLTREDLREFHVIGQVDKKFILLRLQNRIVGFDQHAIDERINVERMYMQLIEQCMSGGESSELEDKIAFETNGVECELIARYEETLAFWGIRFDRDYTHITHLPSLILSKFMKIGFSVLRKGVVEFLYNLGESKKVAFKPTETGKPRGAGDPFWWVRYVSHMPDIYRETIKSKACRSSLMFGEQLSNTQVTDIVRQLQLCYQPFECAHGRPSLYPICGIDAGGHRVEQSN